MSPTTEAKPEGPLAYLGTFLLGLGFTLRLLTPAFLDPLIEALPDILLIAGCATVMLDAGLTRTPRLPLSLLLLPLLLLPGFFPAEERAVARGFDFLAITLGALGLRELVLARGLGHRILHHLFALATLLALLGLAQSLFQRHEAREAAATLEPALVASEQARAFLASDRATATFTNANAFGGFLLLILPWALFATLAPTTRRRALPLLIVLAAAFAASGSAGAALALAGGAAVLLLSHDAASIHQRWIGRTGAALIAAGLLLISFSLAFDFDPPGLEGKLTTFRQRLDYHRIGFRLLPDTGLFGTGFESTATRSRAVLQPRESWSAYLHDTPLQLLIEIGPLVLLAFAAFAWCLVRLLRNPTEAPPDEEEHRGLGRAFTAGVLIAVTLSPFFLRLVTLLPLSLELPALDAAMNLAVLLLALRWLPRPTRALSPALPWSLAAFALHAFLDFDLYMPACAAACALILATLPAQPGTRSAPGPLLLLAGLLLLALPLVVGLFALQRSAIDDLLRQPPGRTPQSAAMLGNVPRSSWWSLRTLTPVLRDGTPAEAEALLASLPPALRDLPITRRHEARFVTRLYFLEGGDANTYRRRLEGLLRPGERSEPFLLERLLRIPGLLPPDEARQLAQRTLDALDRWQIGADEAPWRSELRKLASGR